MSYIVFNKEEKKVMFKEIKLTATKQEDGSSFTQYLFKGELAETVTRLMENGFSTTKVEDLVFSDDEKSRMKIVADMIEENPSNAYFGNVDALDLYIRSGYVDPSTDLVLLKERRNDWQAREYFTKKIKRFITDARKAIEYSSITFKNKQIETTKESTNKLTSLYNSKKLLENYNIVAFKTLDGSFIELDMHDLSMLLKEVQKQIECCFRAELKADEWVKSLSMGQLYMYHDKEDEVKAKFNEQYNKIREVLK